MIKIAAFLPLCLLCCPVLLVRAAEPNDPPAGFTALFNGSNLEQWSGAVTRDPREIAALSPPERQAWESKMSDGIAKHWRVEDGVLVSDGSEPYLATVRDYGDFELWVDWRLEPGGDSGVYLRGVPQVQIWDPSNPAERANGAEKGSGGLWNNQTHERFPAELADAPIGQWNRMYIRMVGEYVKVVLNDHTVVDNVVLENYYDRRLPVFARGPIYLQTHGHETRFRNIFLREIPPAESQQLLSDIRGGEQGFRPLFNGRDLTDWMGATDDYEVVDGAIQCKATRGGNLLTKDMYDNFVVRLEFRLPPGGNNGLAVRTPGPDVNAAYEGLEIQVLDNEAPQYAGLHDYQYHGSVYGLAPAARGYLRPVGEWNYEEVVVDRDHVEVNLNGFKILDTNLDAVRQQPADGQPHPGASRTSGYFGFCGHNDPVAFRNVRIKPLP